MGSIAINSDKQHQRTARYTGYELDNSSIVAADLRPGAVLQLTAGSTVGSPLVSSDGVTAIADDGEAFGRPTLGYKTPYAIVSEDWPANERSQVNRLGDTANPTKRDGGFVPVNSSMTCKALVKHGLTLVKGKTLLGPVNDQFYLDIESESGLLYSNITPSTGIGNTNTETEFDKTYTIPANTLNVGDVLHIRASGDFTAAANSDTCVIKLYIGTAGIGGTVIVATGTPNVDAADGFAIDAFVTIRSIGTAGTAHGAGLSWIGTPGATPAATDVPSGDTTTNTVFTINTTTTQEIALTATWSVVDPADNVVLNDLIVEKIAASGMLNGTGPLAVAMEDITINDSTNGSALARVRLLNPPT